MPEFFCAVVEQTQYTNGEPRLERPSPRAYNLALLLLCEGRADVSHSEG